MSEFVSASAPTGGINWSELKGKLLIVEPLAVEQGVQTVHGTTDPVRANVYALTGPDTADDYPDTLVFPKVLIGQLKNQVGKKVVGRLGQDAAKPGQSAPWVIEEASADDIEKARAYLAKSSGPVSAQAPF